jgi:HPt (histidine-containing phosphotransfer) domain-containing protein
VQTNNNEIVVAGALKDLIPTYLANRKSEVLELRAALAKQDFDRVRFLAHRMKGGGSAYGFPDITVMGRRIENAAHDRQADNVAPLIDQYDGYLQNLSIRFVEDWTG